MTSILIPVTGGVAKRLTPLPKALPSDKKLTNDEPIPGKGHAFDSQPRFSPDGKSIVFISDRDGADNIFVMDAEGGGLRQVTMGNDAMSSPAWSPDGRFIAVRRDVLRPHGTDEHGGELWVYRTEGGAGYRIDTGKPGVVSGMEFAPDGGALYFAAPGQGVRSTIEQLYSYDRNSGKLLQFTDNFGGAVRPRFSHDSR